MNPAKRVFILLLTGLLSITLAASAAPVPLSDPRLAVTFGIVDMFGYQEITIRKDGTYSQVFWHPELSDFSVDGTVEAENGFLTFSGNNEPFPYDFTGGVLAIEGEKILMQTGPAIRLPQPAAPDGDISAVTHPGLAGTWYGVMGATAEGESIHAEHTFLPDGSYFVHVLYPEPDSQSGHYTADENTVLLVTGESEKEAAWHIEGDILTLTFPGEDFPKSLIRMEGMLLRESTP